MKRRDFLKIIAVAVFGEGLIREVPAGIRLVPCVPLLQTRDDYIKDYLHRMRSFDKPFENDIYLDPKGFVLLESSLKRLKRLQRTVGYGNFYLLSFDRALKIARSYSNVGCFSKAEINFLEKVFYSDGSSYGFFGEKPITNLTDRIHRKNVAKIPRTGNYLFKDGPYQIYKRMKLDIGEDVVLTSGIRSVMKQFMLFLNKTYKSDGNLSLASRSLAPPGYSYHGVGDFDVGQVGFGISNFTIRFAKTTVFKKLQHFGYLNLRYPKGNMLGVRFEPWHIKVT